MSVAFLYPAPEKGGRGHKGLRGEGVSDSGALSKARAVLRFSEALADAVMAGEPLDAADDQATGPAESSTVYPHISRISQSGYRTSASATALSASSGSLKRCRDTSTPSRVAVSWYLPGVVFVFINFGNVQAPQSDGSSAQLPQLALGAGLDDPKRRI